MQNINIPAVMPYSGPLEPHLGCSREVRVAVSAKKHGAGQIYILSFQLVVFIVMHITLTSLKIRAFVVTAFLLLNQFKLKVFRINPTPTSTS